MNALTRGNLMKLCFCVSLLTLVLSAFTLAKDIGRPFGGFLTYYNVIANGMYVDIQTPPWWLEPGMLEQLRGHRLRSIDGVSYTYEYEGLGYALAQARREPHVHVTVNADHERISLALPLVQFSWRHFWDFKTPLLLIAIGTLVISVLIYQANRDATTNQVLMVLLCAFALSSGASQPGLFAYESALTKIVHVSGLVSGAFTGALITHFAVLFPNPLPMLANKRLAKLLYILIYGVSCCIAISYISSRLLLWHTGWTRFVRQLDKFSYYATGYYYSIAVIGLGYHSIRVLFNPHIPKRTRNEAKFLLLAMLAYLPYIIITGFDAFGFTRVTIFWQYLDLRYFALAILATFVIIDLRYHTFHKTPQWTFYVLAVIFAALISNISTAVLYSFYPRLTDANSLPPFFIVFVTVTLVSLLWSTQTSWRGWFRRLLYWEQDSYASVHSFGQRLFNHLEFSELPASLVQALCEDLELERAAMWLGDTGLAVISLASQYGAWGHSLPKQLPKPAQCSSYVRLTESNIPQWAYPLAQLGTVEIVVPLQTANEVLGILALGKRWDERIFDERSLEILNLIGQQASLFTLTFFQIQHLQRIPELVTQAQEKERRRLAQELHDTTQQFLGRLPFFLAVSREVIDSDPQKSAAILQKCLVDVEDAAQTLREIRNNLFPMQLNRSFIDSVTTLVERFRAYTQVQVDLELDERLDLKMSLKTRHALYRVLQQALDNIREHAQAKAVKIHVFGQDDYIYFSIADDGVGSSAQQRLSAQQQGSFGLQSMESRVESIGGKFTFNSTVAQGTCIAGQVPLDGYD